MIIIDFSAEGLDYIFGILNIALESNLQTLTITFIENGKRKDVWMNLRL